MTTSARGLPITGLLFLFATASLAPVALCAPAEGRQRVSEQQVKEYQVKAAFLYNFTKFVEWRGTALAKPDDVVICVAGQPARIRVVAETLSEKKGLTVRTLKPGDDAKGCAVFFQSSGEKTFRDSWADLTKNGSLVVSEEPGQLLRGSILNFYLADGKVRFEANLDGAKASGFRLNSQLLQLARIAKPEGGRD